MMTTAHNSIYVVRGLGQVSKLVSLEAIPFDLPTAGRRTWISQFVK